MTETFSNHGTRPGNGPALNMSASDKQVGGDHYHRLGEFQPWDVLRHWLTPEEYRGWMKGNAIVYLARERQKGGDQDIEKAAHHLQKLAEVLADQPIPCCGHPATCENPCFHKKD